MFYLPILNSKCDKDDGASDMNFFRYADDYYNGWAAEQLLLPTAILFSIGVVLLTYVLFTHALKTPLDAGIFGF